MGAQNTSLTIDANLMTAISNVVNSPLPITPISCGQECDLEHAIRMQYWGNFVQDKTKKKKCCSKPDSIGFTPVYEECPPKSSYQNAINPMELHSDIVFDFSGKYVISEIKVISKQKNLMCYLMGRHLDKKCQHNANSLNIGHKIPAGHGSIFTENNTQSQIDGPYGFLNTNTAYFSNLSEGQIWHDIIRLQQARDHFLSITCELYLILFCDNVNNNFHSAATNIDSVLQQLSPSNGAYLYHDGFKSKSLRSKVNDFQYNWGAISPGLSGYGAFWVRIQ